MAKVNYSAKYQLCENLVFSGKKHITSKEIREEAEKLNLHYNTAYKAWHNFVQSGGNLIDRRGIFDGKSSYTTEIKRLKNEGKLVDKKYPTKKTEKTPEEAGEIIREYMLTPIRTHELCVNHNITRNQFYEWIREIEVSGTLFGVRIIDTQKYAKLKILDAIRICKYPYSRKKSIVEMTDSEYIAYERLIDILLMYLPKKVKSN